MVSRLVDIYRSKSPARTSTRLRKSQWDCKRGWDFEAFLHHLRHGVGTSTCLATVKLNLALEGSASPRILTDEPTAELYHKFNSLRSSLRMHCAKSNAKRNEAIERAMITVGTPKKKRNLHQSLCFYALRRKCKIIDFGGLTDGCGDRVSLSTDNGVVGKALSSFSGTYANLSVGFACAVPARVSSDFLA